MIGFTHEGSNIIVNSRCILTNVHELGVFYFSGRPMGRVDKGDQEDKEDKKWEIPITSRGASQFCNSIKTVRAGMLVLVNLQI